MTTYNIWSKGSLETYHIGVIALNVARKLKRMRCLGYETIFTIYNVHITWLTSCVTHKFKI